MLKKPIIIPTPPSISLECMNEQKIARAREYAELALKEEDQILQRIAAMDANSFFSALNDRNSLVSAIRKQKKS
jgi:hypothetical protein